MEGRNAEITVDLVLQARAKISDNKVNGLDDAVVREMINHSPLEKIFIIAKCFQERSLGQMNAPSSWKIVKLVFLRKPHAEPKKGIRSCRAIALTSVISKWYACCVMMRMEKEKELETWKRPRVLVSNLLQRHWEWQEERSPMLKHGSVIRPTMFWASLDIKTAFDEARPRHTAKIMECHNIHGWLIAALSHEVSGFEGKAMFDMCRKLFDFQSMSAPRKRRSSPTKANDGCATTCFRGRKVEREKHGSLVALQKREGASDQLLDYVPLQEKLGKDATRLV